MDNKSNAFTKKRENPKARLKQQRYKKEKSEKFYRKTKKPKLKSMLGSQMKQTAGGLVVK